MNFGTERRPRTICGRGLWARGGASVRSLKQVGGGSLPEITVGLIVYVNPEQSLTQEVTKSLLDCERSCCVPQGTIIVNAQSERSVRKLLMWYFKQFINESYQKFKEE